MAYGTCKLTNQTGKLVRSHLLPKSVSRPPDPSVPRLDGHDLTRPVRRFDSWYDTNIVTRHGEDILEYYDDWAIKELRRLELLWDGRPLTELSSIGRQYENNDDLSVKQVECSDPARLRLFFLSLLWRAASTSLPGYRIDIPGQNVERLRQMLVSRTAAPLAFYPVVLIQLTTVGPWHNAGPQRMVFPVCDSPFSGVNFIRFYFDGLIAHIYEVGTEESSPTFSEIAIGSSKTITILGREFEGSFQDAWLKDVIVKNFEKYPDITRKLLGLDR